MDSPKIRTKSEFAEQAASLFRKLPSIDELLRQPEMAALVASDGHSAVADAARSVLGALRQEISAGHLDAAGVHLALTGLGAAVERHLRQTLGYSLRPVINATGVILHTNLGRAPLSAAALENIRDDAGTYSNLEFNVEAGERGKRDVHVDRLFARLLAGASVAAPVATIVVNNNAAAVFLALNTLAEGYEVIVSRGELVEIGGSFRIPDVMAKSHAVLREVGTTNRTRIADYERAIGERTRLLLRVHRSNFQITGFTEQPALEDLVALGRSHGIPVMEDLGSGALLDLRSVGVEGEPGVSESLAAGVDILTYSGDKLLGGPQAGVISGRKDLVARIRSNPLFRALRVDKLTYAALEATLLAYLRQDYDAIPALRMMRLSLEEIARRAEAVARSLRSSGSGLQSEMIAGESVIGGGAAPASTLPTRLLALSLAGLSAEELASRLRLNHPPIIARVEEDRVLIDLRTVFPGQDEVVVEALVRIAGS
ncbi:MAG TPA: L-seryl-tRNA(Sec) selenium transferase [Terriglobales bacterium]|nr:L-seryl-tRNA(Sec) selenium transferase [Terriglobales bacterium]